MASVPSYAFRKFARACPSRAFCSTDCLRLQVYPLHSSVTLEEQSSVLLSPVPGYRKVGGQALPLPGPPAQPRLAEAPAASEQPVPGSLCLALSAGC